MTDLHLPEETDPWAGFRLPAGVNHQGTVFLTGVSNETTRAAQRPDLGLLGTPAGATWRQKGDYPYWAADNGCFVESFRPGAFSDTKWLRWLAEAGPEGCLFASLPDVVGDHDATWARSQAYIAPVRELGFPVAIVLQNGLEAGSADWAAILSEADAVFVGGSAECLPCGYVRPVSDRTPTCPTCSRKLTEWKLGATARQLVTEARRAGLWTHIGRVNSRKRLRYCAEIGADSADGTYLNFGRKEDRIVNTHKLFGWLDELAEDRANTETV